MQIRINRRFRHPYAPKHYHYLPSLEGEAVLPVIRAMKDFGETYPEGRAPIA
jgi:hypothetical protein